MTFMLKTTESISKLPFFTKYYPIKKRGQGEKKEEREREENVGKRWREKFLESGESQITFPFICVANNR